MSDELPSVPDAVPRWLGARGVTNTSEREEELGLGKWTDVARPLKDFQAAMDSAPVRELEIDEAGIPWMHVLLPAILLAMIGWYFLGPQPESTAKTAVPASPTVPPATPGIPTVTVDTVPSGARVFLEGVDYGLAPTAVPVPTAARAHELCVELNRERTCRNLTGEALAFRDPYRFVISE